MLTAVARRRYFKPQNGLRSGSSASIFIEQASCYALVGAKETERNTVTIRDKSSLLVSLFTRGLFANTSSKSLI